MTDVAAASKRGQLPLTGLEDAQRSILGLLFRAAAFAAIVLIIDVISDLVPSPIAGWTLDKGTVRLEIAKNVLTFIGLPIALLVTLTSLAIATLGPYANASLLLFHRRWPTTWLERLHRLCFGRGNTFHYALQASLFVSVGLIALIITGALNWTQNHMPALIVVGFFAIWEVAMLLYFVYWIIRLRQPADSIAYLRTLAGNSLDRLFLLPRDWGRGDPAAVVRAQDDVEQIGLAIRQATLRSTQEEHRAAALAGLEALVAVYRSARRSYPEAFLQRESGEDANWLARRAIDALVQATIVAAERHLFDVGTEGLRHLDAILTGTLSAAQPSESDHLIAEKVFDGYSQIFSRCLAEDEPNLREELLRRLRESIELLQSPGHDRWRQALIHGLMRTIQDLATPGVLRDDVGILRAVLHLLTVVSTFSDEARERAAELVLDLGATQVALRADRTASMLAGWAAGNFDRAGNVLPRVAADVLQPARPQASWRRPPWVTNDYLQVFLALVAGRGIQFGLPWEEFAVRRIVRGAFTSPPPGGAPLPTRDRCRWVCARIGNVVRLDPEEIRSWQAATVRVVP